MLKLYSFGPSFGVFDPGPFCLKVHSYLRMSGLDYENFPAIDNLRNAPKGKLPFIDDDGELIADSEFIIEHLKAKHGDKLDAWLSAEQKATAYLLTKSLDENFYWCVLHSRWMNETNWPIVKKEFFGSLPFPLKYIIPAVVRREQKQSLYKHGIGRNNEKEIQRIGERSLENLSVLLGDKPYFFGAQVCSFDAVAYGMLAQAISVDLDSALKQNAYRYDNLVQYCKRIENRYYST